MPIEEYPTLHTPQIFRSGASQPDVVKRNTQYNVFEYTYAVGVFFRPLTVFLLKQTNHMEL